MCEYYPASRCGLLAYLAVAAGDRGRGLGRKLTERAIAALRDEARADGAELAAVFGEVHDPGKVDAARDSIPPRERVAVMKKLGARLVPIPYVQPDLGAGAGRARSLMLVAFPSGDKEPTELPANVVERFLRELYEDEDGLDEDPEFAQMLAPLDGDTVKLEPLPSYEKPQLSISKFGIAFHFAFRRAAGEESIASASSMEIDSFERDILAYAYRRTRPFTTHLLAPGPERIVVQFPHRLSYMSEGRTETLVCSRAEDDKPRARTFRLRAARTDFRGGISIVHLILGPADDPSLSELNEYDVIKLSKFWECGEGIPELGTDENGQVFTVLTGANERVSLVQLARSVVGRAGDFHANLSIGVGTIQLLTPLWTEGLFDTITEIKEEKASGKPDATAVALGGILQGLLDFSEVDCDELADVFKDVDLEESRLNAIHKGTLVAITDRDRAFDSAAKSLGISPYLLVPQAVLFHNEVCLREALAKADEVSTSGSSRTRLGAAAWRRSLRRVENRRGEMSHLFREDLLPSVFHYPEERALYRRGWTSRGLDRLARDVERRLTDLGTEIDTRHARLRDVAAQFIAMLLLVFTAFETLSKDVVPDPVVWLVLALVAALYFWRLRV